MGQRSDLQTLFETLADNVYFQPPASLLMNYPCIVYKRDNMNTEFADNMPYLLRTRYLVTVIDSSPDSTIPESIASLQLCLFNRAYVANNLNHDVFILYF